MATVHVMGSINVDLVAFMDQLPVPGETVFGRKYAKFPGGKGANQAIAAARSGAAVSFIGSVGEDEHGEFMLELLRANAIDVQRVKLEQASTGVALIMVGASTNAIAVIPGANAELETSAAETISLQQGDICLAQLEVPTRAIEVFFRRARTFGATTVLNTAPAIGEATRLFPLSDVVVLNETEAAFFVKQPLEETDPRGVVAALRASTGIRDDATLILTMGSDGLYISAQGEFQFLAAHKVPVVDTTGAGDCFCGVLCAGLAVGSPPMVAARWGNAAAALSVGTEGAANSMPNALQIQTFLARVAHGE